MLKLPSMAIQLYVVIGTVIHVDFECPENGHLCTPNVECLFICIKLVNARPIYVCSIYQPPDAFTATSITDLENHSTTLQLPAVD